MLSKAAKCTIRSAKYIHGDNYAVSNVGVSQFDKELKKTIGKISELLSEQQAPKPTLNRHCPECRFQDRCRQVATASDDLSLLGRLSGREKVKLNNKDIFSVTQLSYTFRPRRRPKYAPTKNERYNHSLKARAIREGKTHVIGNPQMKVDGTLVFIDVEGLPDRDFFYLIGLRVESSCNIATHSLWANDVTEEGSMWQMFLRILSGITDPILIHYGSYETTFLKKMCSRHGAPPEGSDAARALITATNLLSVIYACVYFPGYSNGLKEIAVHLGFTWKEPNASGLNSIAWRYQWEKSRDPDLRQRLISYNADDCAAVSLVTKEVLNIMRERNDCDRRKSAASDIVYVDELKNELSTRLGTFRSPVAGFEAINAAARWDHQRQRVYFRSRGSSHSLTRRKKAKVSNYPQKIVNSTPSEHCPKCGKKKRIFGSPRTRTVHDLVYGRNSLKRQIVQYNFETFCCSGCGHKYGFDDRFGHANRKYGWGVLAYFIYNIISLYVSQNTVLHVLNKLLGFDLSKSNMGYLKIRAASYYQKSRDQILNRIIDGDVIHVDETAANIRGHRAYVWVLTNMIDAVFILSDSREGNMIRDLLANFKGVLVSDYYAVYDAIDCPQQKCLIHLMRDLNDDAFKNPFDFELHDIVNQFAAVLKPIVETVDRWGLKKYHLRKHLSDVNKFLGYLEDLKLTSVAAGNYRQRFMKNRDKLFTFLRYDGVAWNNNNAEHAIKAFAALRNIISGPSTRKGTEEYLTLLSVCKSCEYRGLDFLDFLRSGEQDVSSFSGRSAAHRYELVRR